jgi:hypothetical protein
MTTTRSYAGTVVTGHGVASGRAGDLRFPNGTLQLQYPIFTRLGADMSGPYPASINVQIHGEIELGEPTHVFRSVKWHPDVPAEDFSLWRVSLTHHGVTWAAMVYRPHPETKPDHLQPAGVVEVIAPLIGDLDYGDEVTIDVRWER